ncbi:hypothetical protein chiPu_0021965, partial [Chiloscyllium punctatum]|nr:hypothetical protein [Chiloscyllium punctatum]
MADDDEEDWYRCRRWEECSSLEDEEEGEEATAGPRRGPLPWGGRSLRARWEDEELSAGDSTVSGSGTDE